MVGKSISHYIIIAKPGEGGMGVDGGQPRRVKPAPSDEEVPNWSQDGRWVYLASNRSGRYEVWRIPVAGGASAQITHGGGFQGSEAWDRQMLYRTKATGTVFSPLFAGALAGGEGRQVLGSTASWLSFVVDGGGICHVIGSSGRAWFGFELSFLHFTTGKDQIRHKVLERRRASHVSGELPVIGPTVSHYQVFEKLGEGGMEADPAQGLAHAGKWRR